jgi:UDP-glucuronate decarboxylase
MRVFAYDNFIASATTESALKEHRTIEFLSNNIITQPIVFDGKIDFVFHAAGIASPVWYRTHPIETLDVATYGTRNMLDLARAQGASFLYFSSSEIYGDPDIRHVPTSENYAGNVSCRGPRACYDEGKRVGETLCDIFYHAHGVHTVTVRPFNVYGPGLRERDYRVLPSFASRIKGGKSLEVFGTGNQKRTFCYVTDAIVGFMLAILKGVPGEAYNIGNPNPEISMVELAERVKVLLGDKVSYRVVDYPDGYPSNEPQRRCPNIQKAQLQLDFDPIVDIDEGLRRFFEWTERNYTGFGGGASDTL